MSDFWLSIAGTSIALAGSVLFGWAFGARKIEPDGLWTILILFLGVLGYGSVAGLSMWLVTVGILWSMVGDSWWFPFSGPLLCLFVLILSHQITRIIRRPREEAEWAAHVARTVRWEEHRRLAGALGYAMQIRGQTGYSDALDNFLTFLRERNPNVTEERARELATSEMAARAVGR